MDPSVHTIASSWTQKPALHGKRLQPRDDHHVLFRHRGTEAFVQVSASLDPGGQPHAIHDKARRGGRSGAPRGSEGLLVRVQPGEPDHPASGVRAVVSMALMQLMTPCAWLPRDSAVAASTFGAVAGGGGAGGHHGLRTTLMQPSFLCLKISYPCDASSSGS